MSKLGQVVGVVKHLDEALTAAGRDAKGAKLPAGVAARAAPSPAAVDDVAASIPGLKPVTVGEAAPVPKSAAVETPATGVVQEAVDAPAGDVGFDSFIRQGANEWEDPAAKAVPEDPMGAEGKWALPENTAEQAQRLKEAGRRRGKTADWEDGSERTVYHGARSDYDKVDFNYMSSGEGAQVYTWGHYTADKFGVSNSYRKDRAEELAMPTSVVIRGKPVEINQYDLREVFDMHLDASVSGEARDMLETVFRHIQKGTSVPESIAATRRDYSVEERLAANERYIDRLKKELEDAVAIGDRPRADMLRDEIFETNELRAEYIKERDKVERTINEFDNLIATGDVKFLSAPERVDRIDKKGILFTKVIPGDDSKYMFWNYKLSEHEPEAAAILKAAVADVMDKADEAGVMGDVVTYLAGADADVNRMFGAGWLDNITGEDLYNGLVAVREQYPDVLRTRKEIEGIETITAPDEAVSKFLNERGLYGNRYLDYSSRSGLTRSDSRNTYNTVLWNEDLVRIVDKNARDVEKLTKTNLYPRGNKGNIEPIADGLDFQTNLDRSITWALSSATDKQLHEFSQYTKFVDDGREPPHYAVYTDIARDPADAALEVASEIDADPAFWGRTAALSNLTLEEFKKRRMTQVMRDITANAKDTPIAKVYFDHANKTMNMDIGVYGKDIKGTKQGSAMYQALYYAADRLGYTVKADEELTSMNTVMKNLNAAAAVYKAQRADFFEANVTQFAPAAVDLPEKEYRDMLYIIDDMVKNDKLPKNLDATAEYSMFEDAAILSLSDMGHLSDLRNGMYGSLQMEDIAKTLHNYYRYYNPGEDGADRAVMAARVNNMLANWCSGVLKDIANTGKGKAAGVVAEIKRLVEKQGETIESSLTIVTSAVDIPKLPILNALKIMANDDKWKGVLPAVVGTMLLQAITENENGTDV